MSSRSVAEPLGRVGALPNLLTLLRVGLVPVVVVTLMWPTPGARLLAGAFFLVACVTDFLDGWFARRHGVTPLGQLLDPLADKLLVAAVVIMLAAAPPEPRIPAWMAVAIVLREIAVTGLRSIASTGGVVLAAEQLGKYKMIFQVIALEALLLHYPWSIPGTDLVVDFHAAGMVFLWVALVLAIWSGVDYHVRVLGRLRYE